MEQSSDRWALEDIGSAVQWLTRRKQSSISCVIDPLGEYSKNPEQAQAAFQSYINTVQQLSSCGISSAIAVKPSATGCNFDKDLAAGLMRKICAQAATADINVEIDIEGTPTVETICQIAAECAAHGFKTTLALQAYLNRTADDINKALDAGIRVRLVKGAYRGDIEDFAVIQQMFLQCFNQLHESGESFDIGTHDPELIQHITSVINDSDRQKIRFGFLKGLADHTKPEMAAENYLVSEYVPFGNNRKAYETRRIAYLNRLSELKRAPLP